MIRTPIPVCPPGCTRVQRLKRIDKRELELRRHFRDVASWYKTTRPEIVRGSWQNQSFRAELVEELTRFL